MKKCIVLDLDNTLWGGVVGEDGIDGIALSLQAPGNSFIAFQQALLDCYNKGIILAINSRNNPNDAWEVIRNHPNQILKEHHFAAARINWNDKALNIRELAQELNIGLDSMVFFDDDATNRELVKALVPEVTVPDLPSSPKEYTKFFNSLPYFTSEVITDEDKMRGNLYTTERLRKEEEKQHVSKESFLKSLSLEFFIYKNDTTCIPRLAQLTEKTNQFNISKNPFSESEILSYITSGSYDVYHGKLQDCFGDYGVIIFALIKKENDFWNIESLLMSCRVLGKGVEQAFLATICGDAKKNGIEKVSVNFISSEKNKPAQDFVELFFDKSGFAVTPVQKPEWIKVFI